ncbi:hypothetical protein J6590_087213 [Homalodisca vitripennis]|nr:hypothetical protein J6590_087213 [Homalodisca vitripennis]
MFRHPSASTRLVNLARLCHTRQLRSHAHRLVVLGISAICYRDFHYDRDVRRQSLPPVLAPGAAMSYFQLSDSTVSLISDRDVPLDGLQRVLLRLEGGIEPPRLYTTGRTRESLLLVCER